MRFEENGIYLDERSELVNKNIMDIKTLLDFKKIRALFG
jgi:hypothetical protein